MALELLEDKETEVDVITVLKAILSVRDESFDVILKHYIAQATILVENHTCRSITNKKWRYTRNHNILYLPRPKIQKITEVKSDGRILDKDEYKIGYTRDTQIIILDANLSDQVNSVEYVAGYDGCIPPVLINTIIDCAAYLFNQNRVHPESADNNALNSILMQDLRRSAFDNSVYCNVDQRNREQVVFLQQSNDIDEHSTLQPAIQSQGYYE